MDEVIVFQSRGRFPWDRVVLDVSLFNKLQAKRLRLLQVGSLRALVPRYRASFFIFSFVALNSTAALQQSHRKTVANCK